MKPSIRRALQNCAEAAAGMLDGSNAGFNAGVYYPPFASMSAAVSAHAVIVKRAPGGFHMWTYEVPQDRAGSVISLDRAAVRRITRARPPDLVMLTAPANTKEA